MHPTDDNDDDDIIKIIQHVFLVIVFSLCPQQTHYDTIDEPTKIKFLIQMIRTSGIPEVRNNLSS